ncbi:MAG: hypothetical protein AAB785_00600 [Patescibacteria group bacterium]
MTKRKPFLIFIISIILILIIIVFVIWPVVASVWKSWQELKQAQSEQKTVEEKKQIIAGLKTNPRIPEISQIALKYIPKDSESGQLVIELTAIAGSNSLKVEEMSMEKSQEASAKEEETTTASPQTSVNPTATSPPAAAQTKEVDFSMKLSGEFINFMKFLQEIETSSRLISINTIALQSKAPSGTEVAAFDAQIEGAAFSKKEVSLTDTLENIKISNETIEKFLNLKTFGQPINLPTESGFGRSNPFEGY